MTATAPAPSRATGKFTITMGLLSIPLDLFTSTEEVGIKRSQFLADGRSVGTAPCVKEADGSYGDKVERGDIVKRFQTSAGLVELTDDEIDRCSTAVPGSADVLAVHSLDLLNGGHYVPNGKVWQARAGKLGSGRQAKPNPGGEQAYALLLATLRSKSSFLLLRWSRAGSVYVSALLPTGRLIGLYHDEEQRVDRDLPFSDVKFDKATLAMAGNLLDAFREKQPVALVNESVAAVTAYAEKKATTGEVLAPVEAAAAPSNSVDLMAALQASVEAIKAQHAEAVSA